MFKKYSYKLLIIVLSLMLCAFIFVGCGDTNEPVEPVDEYKGFIAHQARYKVETKLLSLLK